MKIINDQIEGRKRFPLGKLIDVILKTTMINYKTNFEILRLGGHGKKVWNYEKRLNEQENVVLPLIKIHEIVQSPVEYIDLIWCYREELVFGLGDSSYLFIQAKDKQIEKLIAREFEKVDHTRPDCQFKS